MFKVKGVDWSVLKGQRQGHSITGHGLREI